MAENSSISFTSKNSRFAISPIKEMGAYEALWDQQGASYKKIADIFKENPEALPSDFVDSNIIESYINSLYSKIGKTNFENIRVRVRGAWEYPKKLRDARHPVELLYYQGWWDLVYTPSVAIVGTRNPTPEGVRRTKKLAASLVKDGYTVVSGLARGVDTVAHLTAITCGGNTIAVIGTPVTECYPKENKELQQLISKNFLLISPVPFSKYSRQDYRLNRLFFPERNKLMSALTEATVIVEAGDTSGTLIQARAALEQGRKLFILNSCFENPNISWPSKYEKKGAIRINDYEDIRKHLVPKIEPNR